MGVRELDCDVDRLIASLVPVHEDTATKKAFAQGLPHLFSKAAFGFEFDCAREGRSHQLE